MYMYMYIDPGPKCVTTTFAQWLQCCSCWPSFASSRCADRVVVEVCRQSRLRGRIHAHPNAAGIIALQNLNLTYIYIHIY